MNIKKAKFSKLVKIKIQEVSLNHLLNLKKDHSKMSRLSYEKLNLQKYLKTPMISTKEAKLIYKYRTRMANVKTNFKFMYPLEDLSCPDCLIHLDTQKHLLNHAETFIDKRRYNKL